MAWKPAAFNPFAISLVRQTLRCWPPVAHRDDQPVLALADIMRDQKLEQIEGLVQKTLVSSKLIT